MNKTLIRSYAIAAEGDIKVRKFDGAAATDLSKEYEDVARDRRKLRADAYLDVFRYDDGEITWSGSPNGHDAANAFSFKLLLDLFIEDISRTGPRAL